MSPRPKTALDISTILEAAGDLANQLGIEEVTLANLAKKLGIRPPSLYNHFDGLGGLRKKMAIYGINRLYEDLAQAGIGVSGDEAVLAISKAYLDFARKQPGVYELTLMAPDPGDEEVQQASKKIVELVVRVLSPFDLAGDRAIHAVRGLRSILHGFASLEQRGGFKLDLDIDESFLQIIKAYIRGLREN